MIKIKNQKKKSVIFIFLFAALFIIPINIIKIQNNAQKNEEKIREVELDTADPEVFHYNDLLSVQASEQIFTVIQPPSVEKTESRTAGWSLQDDGILSTIEAKSLVANGPVGTVDTHRFNSINSRYNGLSLSNIRITVQAAFAVINGWSKLNIYNHHIGEWQYLCDLVNDGQFHDYILDASNLPDPDLSHYIDPNDGNIYIHFNCFSIYTLFYPFPQLPWISIPIPASYWVKLDVLTVELIYDYDYPIKILTPIEGEYYDGYLSGGLGFDYDVSMDVDLVELHCWAGDDYLGEISTPGQLIPVPEPGNYLLYIKGFNSQGNNYTSQEVPITIKEGYLETTLIGSEERFFPHVNTARLGFTFNSIEDIKDYVDRAPQICMSITETQPYVGNVDVKVKIDKQVVWSTSVDIDDTIIFTDINAVKIIEPYSATHQVVFEISNGAGPDNIYRLDYIKVLHVECKENFLKSDLRYAPVETNIYSQECDWASVNFNTQIPTNENGTTRDYSHHFVSSTIFTIEPGFNGPAEYKDVIGGMSCHYYLDSATLNIKILDPNGDFVDNSKFAEFTVLPSVAHDVPYEEMVYFYETLNLIINLLPLPSSLDYLLDSLDIFVYSLPGSIPTQFAC